MMSADNIGPMNDDVETLRIVDVHSPDDLNVILQGLGHAKHLERGRALKQLEEKIASIDSSNSTTFCVIVVKGIYDLLASQVWEHRLGGLMASKVFLSSFNDQQFEEHILSACLHNLEDDEVRVRLAVGDCFLALAKKKGVEIYERCHEQVLASIFNHFDREEEGLNDKTSTSGNNSTDLIESLLETSYTPAKIGVGELRHGTEGWKCLETSMSAFQKLVEGSGEEIKPYLTLPVRELVYRSLRHPNRFVRETGHLTVCTLCKALAGPELAALGLELASRIADGLSDNWSQVRYAASTSCRAFMLALDAEARERVMPVLLGPMCLNRYYVAQGVRLHAQETWRLAMGDEGRKKVAQYVDQVVEYYILQSKANNHAVREAACAVLAELLEKIEPTAVSRHVERVLNALLVCFRDASWPVRDAACTACGRCVSAYPEESLPLLEQLYALWFAHLGDNIPTVRENSAVALAKVVKVYGEAAANRVADVIRNLLPEAAKQPAESTKYSGLTNTTTFGVAMQRARDNDPEVHSGQEMFSCGSLAPKFFSTSALVKSDGCMDYGFSRDREPWEAADGGVYALRELAPLYPTLVTPMLPLLADVAAIRTFSHAYTLHATIWKALPRIAMALGKQAFKPHLELFLGPLFSELKCGHQLTEATAEEAICALRDWLGPRILAGRLNAEQAQALEQCRSVPATRTTAPIP